MMRIELWLSRRFIWAIAVVGAAIIADAVYGQADAPPRDRARPNFVLILADDMGYGDVGALNPNSKIPTPHLDRLVSEGRYFTDAHSPSGVCTPTRYGILTGRYSWRTPLQGVLDGYDAALIEPGRVTLASLLDDAGYQTACVGKWHLGLGTMTPVDYFRPLSPTPNDYGFDYSFIIPASLDMPPYLYLQDGVPGALPTEQIARSEPRRDGGEGYWRAGAIAPGFEFDQVLPMFTEESVEFLRRTRSDGERPFFLYLPLNAPHTPWMPLDEFRGVSAAGYYGDFVAQVDATVGRVLDALDEVGATQNTLVIVTSDNGAWWREVDTETYGHEPNAGRRGQKGDAWDGGHRVPFIVRWPGHVPSGTRSDEIICLTDLLATVAAILGAELGDDAGEDSYNVLPALLGEPYAQPIREATVHFSSRHVAAIRQGRWKLIEALGSGGFSSPHTVEPVPGGPRGQLYDMAADPMEQVNLWLEHPEVVERLTGLLEKYHREGRSR